VLCPRIETAPDGLVGVEVIDLDSDECADLLQAFIAAHPEARNEDIGE
jgi:hypothetical protein